jgi:zinc protease
MLTFGTRTRSALQIAEQIDSLGSQLGATSNIDLSTVSLNVLKRNLDPSLDLFADVIVNANFPPADFARERQQQIAAIQQEKADPVSVTVRVIAPLLYGPGHAYGVPFFSGSGTEESLGKMTAADLVKFHAAWYKPNNSTLIVVGDATLQEIIPKLERAFAAWKPGTLPTKKIGTPAPAAKSRVYLIDRPGSQQTVIATGLVAPAKSEPSDIALQTGST